MCSVGLPSHSNLHQKQDGAGDVHLRTVHSRLRIQELFCPLRFVMWMAVNFFDNWQTSRHVRKLGYEGPVAVAGGWQYLVQVPWVVALLSVAFGLGFYLVVCWVARHPSPPLHAPLLGVSQKQTS